MENTEQYVLSLNTQINNSVDMYIQDMKKALLLLSQDVNLPVVANKDYNGTYESYSAYKNFYNNVRSLLFFNGYKALTVFLYDKKEVLATDLSNSEDFTFYHNALNNSAYNIIGNSKKNIVLLPESNILPDSNEKDFFLCAIKLWPNISGSKDFMALSVDKNLFSKFLNGVNNGSFDDILITTEDDKVIFSLNSLYRAGENIKNDIGNIKSNTNKFNNIFVKDSEYYTIIKNSSLTGWNVVSFINKEKIDRQIFKSKVTIALIATLITLTLIVLINTYLSRSTKDLMILSKMMKNAENDNYQSRSEIERNDEIGELSRSFNTMVKNVLKNQVLRKEAEIKTLQKQINPHFLYNTLDSISSLAMKSQNQQIYETVEKLADFFRYNISIDSLNLVNIQIEIQHVRNYIDIIAIRLGKKLKVNYNIDEDILTYRIERFVIQPIVENAIQHAFNMRSNNYIINIRAYSDNQTIFIEVFDNGSGIEESRLNSIMDYINGGGNDGTSIEESSGGIGLRNVNLRIKYSFGDMYGISIKSMVGHGTCVTVMIPKIK
jgi:Putative regulator of cell autolysis